MAESRIHFEVFSFFLFFTKAKQSQTLLNGRETGLVTHVLRMFYARFARGKVPGHCFFRGL